MSQDLEVLQQRLDAVELGKPIDRQSAGDERIGERRRVGRGEHEVGFGVDDGLPRVPDEQLPRRDPVGDIRHIRVLRDLGHRDDTGRIDQVEQVFVDPQHHRGDPRWLGLERDRMTSSISHDRG